MPVQTRDDAVFIGNLRRAEAEHVRRARILLLLRAAVGEALARNREYQRDTRQCQRCVEQSRSLRFSHDLSQMKGKCFRHMPIGRGRTKANKPINDPEKSHEEHFSAGGLPPTP